MEKGQTAGSMPQSIGALSTFAASTTGLRPAEPHSERNLTKPMAEEMFDWLMIPVSIEAAEARHSWERRSVEAAIRRTRYSAEPVVADAASVTRSTARAAR
jgi:hypothetical protein